MVRGCLASLHEDPDDAFGSGAIFNPQKGSKTVGLFVKLLIGEAVVDAYKSDVVWVLECSLLEVNIDRLGVIFSRNHL